jgi:hypothetical protein
LIVGNVEVLEMCKCQGRHWDVLVEKMALDYVMRAKLPGSPWVEIVQDYLGLVIFITRKPYALLVP